MPALVALLALKSGLSKEKSEDFLKEFFKLISETLREGDSVKIKSLGTFKIMNVETRKSVNVTNGEEILIQGHRRIVFVASKEMADKVNSPFSMFESVELNPEAAGEIESMITGIEKPVKERQEEDAVYKSVETSFVKSEPSPKENVASAKENIAVEVETVKEAEDIIESKEVEEPVEEKEIPYEIETVADQQTLAGEQLESEEQPVSYEERESDYTEPNIVDDSDDEENYNESYPEEYEESEPEQIYSEEPEKRKKFSFWWGMITGILIALLIGGCCYYFLVYKQILSGSKSDNSGSLDTPSYLTDSSLYDEGDEEETENEIIPDTIAGFSEITETKQETVEKPEENIVVEKEEIANTEPSDKTVKDIIGPHNYLTTMAQNHYGDFNLWPYIYEENKSFLGHPDRIKPGTEVVIPPLSKYGVNPKDPKDIRKAKKMGVEIYKRYSK